jgi:predicted nucleotidyltransferase
MPIQTIDISKLTTILKHQFPEVLFAYLFGSASEGSLREGGDVDIALWISDPKIRMELIPRITGVVELFAHGSPCDLIVLNDAGSLLSFEVLQGRLLFVREEAMDIYTGFYSLTCRKYEDDIAWMKKQLKYRGYEVQWDN